MEEKKKKNEGEIVFKEESQNEESVSKRVIGDTIQLIVILKPPVAASPSRSVPIFCSILLSLFHVAPLLQPAPFRPDWLEPPSCPFGSEAGSLDFLQTLPYTVFVLQLTVRSVQYPLVLVESSDLFVLIGVRIPTAHKNPNKINL